MTTSACQHLNLLPKRTFAALAGQTRVLGAGDKELTDLTSAPTFCAMQALIAGRLIDLPITSQSACAAGTMAPESP